MRSSSREPEPQDTMILLSARAVIFPGSAPAALKDVYDALVILTDITRPRTLTRNDIDGQL